MRVVIWYVGKVGVMFLFFFVFKQKTAYEMRISDWSSDVCSSDLGVREIRIREASGAFRVIYLATLEDRVLVLHAFQKKTQATAKKDLELAAQRLKRWKAEQ